MIYEYARIRILTLGVRWKQPRVGQIWPQIQKLIFLEIWDVPWRISMAILWPLFGEGPSIILQRHRKILFSTISTQKHGESAAVPWQLRARGASSHMHNNYYVQVTPIVCRVITGMAMASCSNATMIPKLAFRSSASRAPECWHSAGRLAISECSAIHPCLRRRTPQIPVPGLGGEAGVWDGSNQASLCATRSMRVCTSQCPYS